mmetsp:Transcript_10004/g.14982  ORF Transcript_10004/g.14982 Transcript_10004/m.14982 type:complete len:288 (+) Transcript_10004:986-1849(+)
MRKLALLPAVVCCPILHKLLARWIASYHNGRTRETLLLLLMLLLLMLLLLLLMLLMLLLLLLRILPHHHGMRRIISRMMMHLMRRGRRRWWSTIRCHVVLIMLLLHPIHWRRRSTGRWRVGISRMMMVWWWRTVMRMHHLWWWMHWMTVMQWWMTIIHLRRHGVMLLRMEMMRWWWSSSLLMMRMLLLGRWLLLHWLPTWIHELKDWIRIFLLLLLLLQQRIHPSTKSWKRRNTPPQTNIILSQMLHPSFSLRIHFFTSSTMNTHILHIQFRCHFGDCHKFLLYGVD